MENSLLRRCGKCYCGIKSKITHWNNLLTDPAPKLLILTYHRILPEIKFNPLKTIVSLNTFIKQIDVLTKKFSIISLSEAVSQMREGQVKNKIQVVFTFDDGYRDNYEIVFPLLSKRKLPAVFFISTDYVGSNMPLWDWEIIIRMTIYGDINEIKTPKSIFKRRINESRSSFAFRIFEEMKSADIGTVQNILGFLRKETAAKTGFHDFKGDGFMNWTHIRQMSQAGMEIGAHGTTHRPLLRIPFGEAVDEIRKSKLSIENNTGKPCLHFSFPFGSQKDYNRALIDSVKDAGFQTCMLNIHGYNHMERDGFCFKRIIMENSTDIKHLLG